MVFPVGLLPYPLEPILGAEKAAFGLAVGDRGCLPLGCAAKEGDLTECSEGLLNPGVAEVYCSRALIWEPGCGRPGVRCEGG